MLPNYGYAQHTTSTVKQSQVFGLGNLWGITYSPNGRFIASYGTAGVVLWDTNNYKASLLSSLISHVEYAVFISDSRLLALVTIQGIEIWNIEIKEILTTLPNNRSSKVSTFNSLAFSPDGKTLAVNNFRTVELWNIESWQIKDTLYKQNWIVGVLAFSPDSSRLAIGLEVNNLIRSVEDNYFSRSVVKIWNIEANKFEATFKVKETSGNYNIVFSPDGKLLAVASVAMLEIRGHFIQSSTVILWDLKKEEEYSTIHVGKSGFLPFNFTFTPDGDSFITGENYLIRFWDIDKLKDKHSPESVLENERSHSFFALSPDGYTLATADFTRGTITLWDTQTLKPYKALIGHASTKYADGWPSGYFTLDFSLDGNTLAASAAGSNIFVWDVNSGEVKDFLEGYHSNVLSLSFNSNGKLFLANDCGKIKAWDIINHKEVFSTEHCTQKLGWDVITLSPDGNLVATGQYEYKHDEQERGVVKLWDTRNGNLRVPLKGHKYGVYSLAFNSEGNLLASGGKDGTIRLWDVERGKPKAIFWDVSMWVFALDFSPENQILASFSSDGFIRLWDLENSGRLLGKMIKKWRVHGEISDSRETSRVITFNSDGKTLASVVSKYKTIKLWDVESGELKVSLEGHSGWVTDITFDSTGSYLASSSADGTVRLWDVRQWTNSTP